MHKSRVTQTAVRGGKFEQLNHSPYSADLAPSDYYLFRNLKSRLRGTRFRDNGELKIATVAELVWGSNIRLSFQRQRLLKKCIEVYAESKMREPLYFIFYFA